MQSSSTDFMLKKGTDITVSWFSWLEDKNLLNESARDLGDSEGLIDESLKNEIKKVFKEISQNYGEGESLNEVESREMVFDPVGLFHSQGTGFVTVPTGSIDQVVADHEREEGRLKNFFGMSRLSMNEAKFSARSYNHYASHAKKERRHNSVDYKNYPALDRLLKIAYIPLPEPIHKEMTVNEVIKEYESQVIGPIPLGDDTAIQLLNLVKGPSVHDQLSRDKKVPECKVGKEKLHRLELLAISQITGVFQANPLDSEDLDLSAISSMVKEDYTKRLKSSVEQLLKYVGLEEKDEDLKLAFGFFDVLGSKLKVRYGDNMGRYFDSALRNWIWDLGDYSGTSLDVMQLLAVEESGKIEYELLWKYLKRVDFSNSDRVWAVYEEDAAHINENLNVQIGSRQKESNIAVMALTRKALEIHEKASKDEDYAAANELAERCYEIICGREAREIPEVSSYLEEYGATIKIVSWYRKLRQAELAIQYYAKAFAYNEKRTELSQTLMNDLSNEANEYVSMAIGELDELFGCVVDQECSTSDAGRRSLENLLSGIKRKIENQEYSPKVLKDVGDYYLNNKVSF